jgi:transposase
VRLLLSARRRFVEIRTTLYNQIRGLLKTFGVVLAPGKGGTFVRELENKMPTDPTVRMVIEALLATWKAASEELKKLDRSIEELATGNDVHRLLMTVPGVGAITAAAYVATIDTPERFARSSEVGAYLGLTPRRYQSGEVDRNGRISKCGDAMLRALLFEAAHALLTRTRQKSDLRRWGWALARKTGPGKAKVAVARKLAVIMHRMWTEAKPFRFAIDTAKAA